MLILTVYLRVIQRDLLNCHTKNNTGTIAKLVLTIAYGSCYVEGYCRYCWSPQSIDIEPVVENPVAAQTKPSKQTTKKTLQIATRAVTLSDAVPSTEAPTVTDTNKGST
jgi:hypothetical protein